MNSFLEKHVGKLFLLLIIIIFGGYIAYNWYFSEPMPDCGYTDTGCQGDNSKFGQ